MLNKQTIHTTNASQAVAKPSSTKSTVSFYFETDMQDRVLEYLSDTIITSSVVNTSKK